MSNDITIKIPDNVKNLMQRVLNFGYEIYVVGGCVRDTLRHRTVADYDLTTNALPIDIIGIFSDCNVIETGLQHGTVTVVFNNEMFEITTFRIDGEYTDNRHPDTVTFTNSLFEDLSRRDFTINAMAADINGNVIDFFNGIEDLKKKLIRCVGNPSDRFNEDALRILRAYRFQAKIGGEIEPNTMHHMLRCSHLLKNIAQERTQKELNGILVSGDGGNQVSELINAIDILKVVIPELHLLEIFQNNSKHKHQWLMLHTIHVVATVESDLVLKLAALFHDIGKYACYSEEKLPHGGIEGHFYGHANESAKITEDILRRLRYSNDTIEQVVWLVKMHDSNIIPNKIAVKKILNQCPSLELFNKLIKLKIADQIDHVKLGDIGSLLDASALAYDIVESQEAFSIKQIDIDGYDLMNIGLIGKDIGEALQFCLNNVIEETVENRKDCLVELVKEKLIDAKR